MTNETLLQLDLPGIKKLKSGKVREVFDLGDHLLFVATDRISAFDVIMPNGIPRKGEVLTQISYFWFTQTEGFQPNHLVSHAGDSLPSSELPEPIFTPATKAETGHDENISFEESARIVGADIAERARSASLKIYNFARDYALKRGIIIADTKFEFGLLNGDLILIDEVLTPDSSRFWPADQYEPGRGQPSFDKQFVRDYLETLDWNKTPPAPVLPADVVANTTTKYLEAYERLTGVKLSGQ